MKYFFLILNYFDLLEVFIYTKTSYRNNVFLTVKAVILSRKVLEYCPSYDFISGTCSFICLVFFSSVGFTNFKNCLCPRQKYDQSGQGESTKVLQLFRRKFHSGRICSTNAASARSHFQSTCKKSSYAIFTKKSSLFFAHIVFNILSSTSVFHLQLQVSFLKWTDLFT